MEDEMKDKNGQTVDVVKEWHRASLARITLNKGKPDERDVLLDADGIRELISDLTQCL